jgi:hypothetical protein
MPTALLVTADLGGNVPPMLGLARTLLDRGWTVEVLGDAAVRDRFVRAGAGFTPSTGQDYDPVHWTSASVPGCGRSSSDTPCPATSGGRSAPGRSVRS